MAYKTAKQLGILPEERKALIAFVKAPFLGRTIEVNGHAHYYDQNGADNPSEAEENECGTAGCVAGYVYAHAKIVQKVRRLRGCKNADEYIGCATEYHDQDEEPVAPVLYHLYIEGGDHKLAEARRVVDKMLRTGRVEWR